MNRPFIPKLESISNEALLTVIEQAKDYAMYKGLGMRNSSLSRDARVHLPFCLMPCELPKVWFSYVYDLQTTVNLILFKIAYSKEILTECLQNTIKADEFTRNLFNIYEKVYDGQSKVTCLGIIRSDYLPICDYAGSVTGIKQVENNTVAVGFGGISPMLRDLYKFVLKKLGWKDLQKLPENESCEKIADAMIAAWNVYGRIRAIILFVVEESTFNIYDQRLLEYKILELDNQTEVMRCTFKELRTSLYLKDEKLFVNDKEIAVVYFRVGYAPNHYELQDWKTRLLIEQSKAIKCPSVGLHLAGTKRVQLYLTQKGVLEKFVEAEVAEKLRKVFASQYSLDTEDRNAIISNAMKYYDSFVLKPEREGGGNNLYGLDIKKFFENEETRKDESVILMDKIKSPEMLNVVVRSDKPIEFCQVTNELGIYGVILGDNNYICKNETVGHLLRSKPINLNEGGVASGNGALNYLHLL